MGSQIVIQRAWFRLSLLAVLAILVGCSTAVPSDAGPVSGSRAIATPLATRAPRPITLRPDRILLDEPAIDLTLPVGWREVTVEEWTQDLAALPDGASRSYESFVSRLESGQVLTTAEGFTERAVSVQVEVSMDPAATNVLDAMSNIAEALAQTGTVEEVETGTLSSPIGTVVRARYVLSVVGDPETAVPAHLMAYLVPLGTEGTVVIHSFGRQADPSHPAMLDEMISTLDINNGLSLALPSRPWVGSIEEANVSYVFPETFVPVPLDGLRDGFADLIRTGGYAGTEIQRIVDAIDARILRLQLSSQKPLGVGRNIRVMVHRDAGDLESAIGRVLEELGNPEVLSHADVELPIGEATRLQLTVPDAGIPVIDELYILPLDDGTSLTIAGRGGQDDAGLHGIVLDFAKSFEQVRG